MSTRLEIIDEALVSIGCLPLQSETAPGADDCIREYETIKDAILSAYPWTFSTPTRRLSRLSIVPEIAWSWAYAKPVEMIGAPRAAYDQAECRRAFFDWELTVIITSAGERVPVLATNAENVWLTFTSSIDPQWWPGYVRQIIVILCKAQYALSLREDKVLHDSLNRDVYGSPTTPGEMGLLGRAQQLDGSSKPSAVLTQVHGANPLIMARR